MYREEDLVRIAKRENNKKRGYLVVNRLQGKHIPVEPGQALEMFRALALRLKGHCARKRVLAIGFAETATAIGAAVAAELDAYYMQTTREDLAGARYLYFSEEHSHATQQRLVKDDLDVAMPKADLVVFVEDEVTTGNTILNLVNALEKEYPGQAAYAVASILNGMDGKALELYDSRKIRLFYLAKTRQGDYAEELRRHGYAQRGDYFSYMDMGDGVGVQKEAAVEKEFEVSGWMDARRLVSASEYTKACGRLWDGIARRLHAELSGRILVLGTEEFMYPALFVAEQIAKGGASVWFHATTRSPIEVFGEGQYPLHVRYELPSLYDKGRRTFVYDIGAYDAVLAITDAHHDGREGIDGLVRALAVKNDRIYVVRWR